MKKQKQGELEVRVRIGIILTRIFAQIKSGIDVKYSDLELEIDDELDNLSIEVRKATAWDYETLISMFCCEDCKTNLTEKIKIIKKSGKLESEKLPDKKG